MLQQRSAAASSGQHKPQPRSQGFPLATTVIFHQTAFDIIFDGVAVFPEPTTNARQNLRSEMKSFDATCACICPRPPPPPPTPRLPFPFFAWINIMVSPLVLFMISMVFKVSRLDQSTKPNAPLVRNSCLAFLGSISILTIPKLSFFCNCFDYTSQTPVEIYGKTYGKACLTVL